MIILVHSLMPPNVNHLDHVKLQEKARGTEQSSRLSSVHWWPYKDRDSTSRKIIYEHALCSAQTCCEILGAYLKLDNGSPFHSARLKEWTRKQSISLRFSSLYHSEVNYSEEQAISHIKQFIPMYTNITTKWTSFLEVAVVHDTSSYTSGTVWSLHFTLTGEVSSFTSHSELGLTCPCLHESFKTNVQ